MPAARLPLALCAAAEGQRVEIRTERLQADLGTLLRWAGDSGIELAGLDARAASLEEAFLEIAENRRGPAGRTGPMAGAR